MISRASIALGVAAALAAIGTVLVSVDTGLDFGYRSPTAQTAIETGAALVSLLVAYLVYGRYRSSRSAGDLRLAVALALLVAANLARGVAPTVSEAGTGQGAIWIPLACHIAAAAMLARAAVASAYDEREPRPQRAFAGGALVLASAVLLGALAAETISTGIDPNLSPTASERPRITGAPMLLASQLVIMALLAVAAWGFVRRARSSDDELLRWLAAGTALGAFARLHYFLFPSNYTDYIFTGDFLRLAFYVFLLVGTLRQIAIYQQRAAEAAVDDERRRIARDLHDGLAQELAFISMKGRRLAAGNEAASQIVSAADRALADSRGAILALSEAGDEPLAASIARVGGVLAGRQGAALRLEVDEELVVDRGRREAILRIVSEAISNATRHGDASEIAIQLDGGEPLRLVVTDNGSGFDPAAVDSQAHGLGLDGMRERVERLGGRLELRSQPGGGAEVEVIFS